MYKRQRDRSEMVTNLRYLSPEITLEYVGQPECDEDGEYFTPLIYCTTTMDEAEDTNDVENSSLVLNHQTPPKKRKKFKCHLCDKQFGWTTDLKRHILIHTGERPFKCDLCMATFTRNFLLQKHQSKMHQCMTPNEVTQLNNKVAENVMEIKMKMMELEKAKAGEVVKEGRKGKLNE